MKKRKEEGRAYKDEKVMKFNEYGVGLFHIHFLSYLLLCTGMAVSISSFPGGMILCLFLGSLDGEAAQPP